MKIYLLTLSFMLCLSSLVSGQTGNAPGRPENKQKPLKPFVFRLGVEVASNIALYNCKYNSTANYGSITYTKEQSRLSSFNDLKFGLKLETKLHRMLYLQSGALFAKRRFERAILTSDYKHYYVSPHQQLPSSDHITLYSYELRSVDVPFYLTYKSYNMGFGRITAGLGPYISFNMSATEKESAYPITTKLKIGGSGSLYKSIDYGASCFIGVSFFNRMNLNVQYWKDLHSPISSTGLKIHHQDIAFTAAYLFRIKIKRSVLMPDVGRENE